MFEIRSNCDVVGHIRDVAMAQRLSSLFAEDKKPSYVDYVRGLEAKFHDFALSEQEYRTVHGILGIAGEAGELVDQAKRRLFYGLGLDRVNIIEECGDMLFYLTVALDSVGSTIQEAIDVNRAKLDARYPNGFSTKCCVERDTDNERTIMEEATSVGTQS